MQNQTNTMKLAYAPAGIDTDTITVAYVPADADDWSTGDEYPNTGLVVFSNDHRMSVQCIVAYNGAPAIDYDAAREIARELLQMTEESEERALLAPV